MTEGELRKWTESIYNARWKAGFLAVTWGIVAAGTIAKTNEYPLMAIYSLGSLFGMAGVLHANKELYVARLLQRSPAARESAPVPEDY